LEGLVRFILEFFFPITKLSFTINLTNPFGELILGINYFIPLIYLTQDIGIPWPSYYCGPKIPISQIGPDWTLFGKPQFNLPLNQETSYYDIMTFLFNPGSYTF